MDFNDAGGFDARAQDVLLGRHVILGAEALQIIQEASVTDHGGDGSKKHTHTETQAVSNKPAQHTALQLQTQIHLVPAHSLRRRTVVLRGEVRTGDDGTLDAWRLERRVNEGTSHNTKSCEKFVKHMKLNTGMVG